MTHLCLWHRPRSARGPHRAPLEASPHVLVVVSLSVLVKRYLNRAWDSFCAWSFAAPLVYAASGSAAPPRGAACDLTGMWSGSLGGNGIGPPNLALTHDLSSGTVVVSGAVSTTGTYFPTNLSLVFNAFPGYPLPLVGVTVPFNGSSDACSEIAWQAPYTPPGSFWRRNPAPQPPANWTNEVNTCADGREPPSHVATMYINPCSQGDVGGTNFTIPAQQFSVATLANETGGPSALLYFGERFRSSPSGNKSADFQCECLRLVCLGGKTREHAPKSFADWAPLEFDDSGALLRMTWVDSYNLTL